MYQVLPEMSCQDLAVCPWPKIYVLCPSLPGEEKGVLRK